MEMNNMADENDLNIYKGQLKMYKDMIVGALKNKGVMFILLCFLVVVVLAFAIGYVQGVKSVDVICPVCII